MIVIVNLRSEKPKHPWDFRVDRQTPVGNPFVMDGENSRDEVCQQYQMWFNQKNVMRAHTPFHQYLTEIANAYLQHRQVRLFCWCAPKLCHAETIKLWLLKRFFQPTKNHHP